MTLTHLDLPSYERINLCVALLTAKVFGKWEVNYDYNLSLLDADIVLEI